MPKKKIQKLPRTRSILSSIDLPLLVDLKNASEILGIARSSVRRLIRIKSLPAIHAGKGGKLFIPRAALTEFVRGLQRVRIYGPSKMAA
jgi:excisionase family DNA binding protein